MPSRLRRFVVLGCMLATVSLVGSDARAADLRASSSSSALADARAFAGVDSIDFGILSCSIGISDSPDSVALEIEFIAPAAPDSSTVYFEVLFDSTPVDQHPIDTKVVPGSQVPCPQNPPACSQPVPPPCAMATIETKNKVFAANGECTFVAPLARCKCLLKKVLVKLVPVPPGSGTYTIVLDPDGEVVEYDEGNNVCEVFYAGPTPAHETTWGKVKHGSY